MSNEDHGWRLSIVWLGWRVTGDVRLHELSTIIKYFEILRAQLWY